MAALTSKERRAGCAIEGINTLAGLAEIIADMLIAAISARLLQLPDPKEEKDYSAGKV